MKLIKAFLITNEEINQDAKRNANTQTKGIDERIHFALKYVTRGYFKIITDHNGLIYSELKFVSEDDAGSEKTDSSNEKFQLCFLFTTCLYIVII
jgi:hypothetical protein